MTAQAEDSARLQDILGAFHAGAATRQETHATVLDLILERIQCSRVSLWHFADDGGAPSLLCFASKTAGTEPIVSLLDAAFLLNSRAYGRVCCEETAQRSAWPASDVYALRGIVNKLALLMWSAPASILPALPSLRVRAAPAPAAALPIRAQRRRH